MNRLRPHLTALVLRAAGWNLQLLARFIAWATPNRPVTGYPSLPLPVETVTQQLRTIDVLMARIGRAP